MATIPDPKHRLSFPGLDGLYGWVTVDGQPLEVYGVECKERKTVAYIEAQEGKQFEVVLRDDRTTAQIPDSYSVRLMLDGSRVAGNAWDRNDEAFSRPLSSRRRSRTWRGKRLSSTTIAPMIFSKLRLTDDDDEACTDEATVKNLGTLQLCLWRVSNVRYKLKTTPWTAPQAVKPIHEQGKKASAVSHQAEYGAAVAAKPVAEAFSCDFVDRRDSPFSVVEFRYRSRQILQLEGHIPASPSPAVEPSLSPSPRPVAGPSRARQSSSSTPATATSSKQRTSRSIDLDDDALAAEIEMLEREQRIAQLKREQRRRSGAGGSGSLSQQKVKAEPGEVDERDRKRIKLEDGERAEAGKEERRRKGKKHEIIDLCDSD